MLKKTITTLLIYLILFIALFIIYFPFIHLNIFNLNIFNDSLNVEISIKLIELLLIGVLFWIVRDKLIYVNRNIENSQILLAILLFLILFVFKDILLSNSTGNQLLINQILHGRPLMFDFKKFICFVILAPIIEELVFRKLMITYLLPGANEDLKKVLFYTLLISLIFSISHTDYEWYNLLGFFVFSFVLTLYYHTNRNIIIVIFFHMFFNLIPNIYGQS